MGRMSEEALRNPIRKWVEERGLDPKDEVPMYGKVPDVLGLEGDRVVVAIEMKVSNWQRALYQALIYTMFALESYIAMPETKKKVLLKNMYSFDKWNIGILTVDANNRVLILRAPVRIRGDMRLEESSETPAGELSVDS